MTTKDYLSQLERLDRTIKNKASELYQLETMACSITVAADGERVQKSVEKDKLGKAVAKIVDLENEISGLIEELLRKRGYIIKQIEGIDNDVYYQILFSRYVSRENLDQIAKEIPCSYRQVTREHGKALLEFEKLYGKEYI